MSDEYAEVFKEETYELLEEAEKSLLELEKNPDDAEVVAKIFRAIHTIKGSGAMFGFDMISAFAHELENAFELVRSGSLKCNKGLIDITLSGMDFIKNSLELESQELDKATSEKRDAIIARLNQFISTPSESASTGAFITQEELPKEFEPPAEVPVTPEPEPVVVPEPEPETVIAPEPEPQSEPEEEPLEIPGQQPAVPVAAVAAEEVNETTYRIRFEPSADIIQKGTELLKLMHELYELGTCHSVARVSTIPSLEEMDPHFCYSAWDIILTTTHHHNTIKDIFIFVEGDSKITIERIESSDTGMSPDYKKLGRILVEKGEVSEEKVEEISHHKKRFGELLVDEGIVEPEKVESALVEQQHVRDIRKKRMETEAASTLRVSADKVDILVNLVGELVTLQARLAQLSYQRNDGEMISLAEDVERITWELRDNSMEMRMLPIGSTFSRFKRLVRDLSNSLGKEVELVTEGGDTELDKTVIEKLNDPLVHIIRNSIDHGIEPPEARANAGKHVRGIVKLNAFHSGSNVVIQITDDGAGLDVEKIKHKAVERGIIGHDSQLSDKEVFALIFEPGFSTAKKVSDVSGRGVGMDVVKRNIEALRGFIDIDSQPGQGTVFTLNIPLTLAIIDGLLVKIGQEHFVFPLSLVESCLEIRHQEIVEANGQNYLDVRGEIVPYIYLREQFELFDDIPKIEQIVIALIDKKRVGFVVDTVIGGHQTVIKSLGKVYKDVEGISGATILGDGTIALILDTLKLVTNAGLNKNKFQLNKDFGS